MGMFKSAEDCNRADWSLLQNGAVSLFWSVDVLNEVRGELTELDYEIAEVSCLNGEAAFRRQMSNALNWESNFGYSTWNGNLDAFNDGLREYPFGASKLCALAVLGFHKLVGSAPEFAGALLDIIEYNARDHLLFGNTLIALVQTDDNQFESPVLGGRTASWNSREWSNDRRGI